jgi:TldD protein
VTLGPSNVHTAPSLVIGIGVRAFVNGYWGFASSPYWTADDAAELGKEAAEAAKVAASTGKPRDATLPPIPIVRDATWIQPGIDPFSVPVTEKIDWLRALPEVVAQYDRLAESSWDGLRLWRDARVFVSSEGASYTQVRYQCRPGQWKAGFQSDETGTERGNGWEQGLWGGDAFQAHGWEMMRDLPMDRLAEPFVARARTLSPSSKLTVKPVDIGKFDVVFGAGLTANLVYHTLGVGTELDRALGYEANAGGTSYLGPDPLKFLGTPVANPLITLTANRTTPCAMATAQWDDEGMPCQEFPLIQDGILVDYQTTREQAAWLAPWYANRGRPVQSHGCAVAQTALDCPIQQSPNFVLSAGASGATEEDLIKTVTRGIYFPPSAFGEISMDQQVKNGVIENRTAVPEYMPREIRNGKLGAHIANVGILFRTQEFWKHVQTLGGSNTTVTVLASERKGEPSQEAECNVTAGAMLVRECTIVNAARVH